MTLATRAKRSDVIEMLKKAGGVDPSPTQEAPPNVPKSKPDTRPVALNFPRPNYTAKAREKRVYGIVVLRLLIGNDGRIKRMTVVKGLPYGLIYEAAAAPSAMRFKPAMKDGQPVDWVVMIEVEFNLRD